MSAAHRGLVPRLVRLAAAVPLLGAAACATSAASRAADEVPPAGNSFAVVDVRVFDGERVVPRATVVVRDGLIVAVGDAEPPADLPRIDGSGRTLLPGLIDAHAHVQSELALRDALRFGVTTALDMFTSVDFMQAHRAQRDLLAATALADLFSAGAPVTSPGGMGTQFGIPFPTLAGPEEAAEFVRARLAEGSDYIKVLYEPEAGIVTTLSAETLAAVVAAAHAQGALAVAHVTSLAGAQDAVAAGADGLTHLFGDRLVDSGLARQMAARGMFVIPTLSLFAAIDGMGLGPELVADPRLAPFLTAAQRERLAAPAPAKDSPMAPYLARFDLATATENVRRLHAAGVRVLAGDDVPNLGAHGVSMHGELALLTRAGLTPGEALAAATSGPAEAFRLGDRGRIAAGARADLVLVEGNPLVDIAATRAIVRVFKNGFAVDRAPGEAPPPDGGR